MWKSTSRRVDGVGRPTFDFAQVPKHVREMFGLPNADRRATPRAPRSLRGPPMSPRSPALELPPPRSSPRRKPEAKATPRKKAKAEAPPPQPAAAPAKKKPPFRAFEERWERRATHKRSVAAEKQLLAKYGGREFRDDDGTYVISTDNLEWCDDEWTVLAQKKRAPSKKQRKEEYEGYCVNAQLRKMIARSLPARDVQRK